jgi:nucleoside 2-deoxyribosyltransferase
MFNTTPKKKWFISHPSGGMQHTPLFYETVKKYVAEHEEEIELTFPHEKRQEIAKTKQDIEAADLVLAEVSIASTGSGIELGWANAAGKPIIAFYQGVEEASPAIQFVTKAIHPYITEEHIIKVLETL